MSTIGMMEGAFFVGRKEIMDWVNSTLDLNLAKVEDTASGAVACQLLDIMYPGQVPMHKVNWAAKQDFEFVSNYKVLQTCFTKLNIDRHIDVDRLISGKYMDNLEFMQWFKRFFEMNVSDKGDYDAVGQRMKGKGGAQFGGSAGSKKVTPKPASAPAAKAPAPAPRTTTTAPPQAPPASKPVARQAPAPVVNEVKPATINNQENAAPNNRSISPASNSEKVQQNVDTEKFQTEIINLRQSLEESHRAYAEMKQDFEGLEKERDFYFEKLRDVEILLQEMEDKGQGSELSNAIFKILYATAEGFEPVNEEGGSGSNIPSTPHKGGYHEEAVVGETF